MRFRHGLILALTLALGPAASAQAAEPDFKGTLNGATPKFTWESSGTGTPGGPDVGPPVHCAGGPAHCEHVLLNVEAPGELVLTLESPDGQSASGVPLVCPDATSPCASFQDLDGNLYKSDASGAKQGDSLTNGDAEAGEPDCSSSKASESCKLKVEAGFYVFEVSYFFALEAPMKGTAELVGAAAPVTSTPTETTTPPPAQGEPQPQPQPQPQSQPQPQPQQPAQAQSDSQAKKKASAKKRRAACTKKAKKIKNKGKRAKALKRCKKIR